MKLSNWSVVLATSIIVDSNSTSEDIGNYFPPTLVVQNTETQEDLAIAPQHNRSSDLSVGSGWAGDPGHVGVEVTTWELWGTQPGVYHVSLSLNISWTREQDSQLGMPLLLRLKVRYVC